MPEIPEVHRGRTEKYIRDVIRANPLIGNGVRELFEHMKEVLGDRPPLTWKFKETTFKNIQFRLRDKKTERWRDFLLLSGFSETKNIPRIHMSVKKEYVKPEHEILFPITTDYWGQRFGKLIYEKDLQKNSIKKYKSVLKSIAEENSYYPLPVSEHNND